MTATIEFSKMDLQRSIEEKRSRRVFLKLQKPEFIELLSLECKKVLLARQSKPVFDIDKFNEPIINILFEYATNPNCSVNTDKGIILAGSIGAGKTVLIKGFCNLITFLTRKTITNMHAMKLASIIRENGIDERMIKVPMFIDDIGKENESVKSFGTEVKPLIELFALRYDAGSWTFGTTNYKLETLMEKYTEHTADRLIEMFNYIILPGESRRK